MPDRPSDCVAIQRNSIIGAYPVANIGCPYNFSFSEKGSATKTNLVGRISVA